MVVNCFQFSNFSEDSQELKLEWWPLTCCELLYSYTCPLFSKGIHRSLRSVSSLILVRIHRCSSAYICMASVVNCFQFSNFSEDSQEGNTEDEIKLRCELLSVL